MSWEKWWNVFITLPLITACLALVVVVEEAQGRLTPWQPLGQPPEPAVAVVSITDGLWVRAASGQVYVYDANAASWATAEAPSVPPTEAHDEKCQDPPALTDVIDRKAACFLDIISRTTIYVVRADGSVYRWEHFGGETFGVMVGLGPVIGGLIGIGIDGLLVVALWLGLMPRALSPRRAAKQ